jgi:hypothetical protein
MDKLNIIHSVGRLIQMEYDMPMLKLEGWLAKLPFFEAAVVEMHHLPSHNAFVCLPSP